MTDKIQALMNSAYGRYTHQMSQQAFWDQLDAKERIAVFFGNLNYQVENGGYRQWIGNRYAQQENVEFLIRKLREMSTAESAIVLQHLAEIRDLANEEGWDSDRWDDDAWEALDLDSFDHSFYEVNAELLKQVEEKLLV